MITDNEQVQIVATTYAAINWTEAREKILLTIMFVNKPYLASKDPSARMWNRTHDDLFLDDLFAEYKKGD